MTAALRCASLEYPADLLTADLIRSCDHVCIAVAGSGMSAVNADLRSLRTARTAVPGLSDNQWIGVEVIRAYVWIAVVMVLGGLCIWAWWYRHLRAWSTRKQDETMRRHVNRNYD